MLSSNGKKMSIMAAAIGVGSLFSSSGIYGKTKHENDIRAKEKKKLKNRKKNKNRR